MENKHTRIKTEAEIVAMEAVQRATEAATQSVIEYLQSSPAPTAEEAHTIIDEVLAECNCHSPEGHIVAAGEQSVEPHEIGTGAIPKHVPIVIDIFPQSKETDLFADMTRTVCIDEPSEALQQMYGAVKEGLELGMSLVKPGVHCADVHNAVAELLESKGYKTSGEGKEFRYAEGFVHSLGHGVGTSVHEAPLIGARSEEVFLENEVVTIEPGLYYPKFGGIRLENMVLVTKDGYRNLTHYPLQFSI